jgi:hypothetical protein
LKVLIAIYAARPVSISEAALTHLQIPIVSKSVGVEFIKTPLPEQRTRRFDERSRCFSVAPVDVYCGRPSVAELNGITLGDYFMDYLVTKDTRTRYRLVGEDAWSNRVYKLPYRRIVRFTDYHPVRHPEGFFYIVLLHHASFSAEEEFLSDDNDHRSYVLECFLRGIVTDTEDIQGFVDQYCVDHLYTSELHHQMLNRVLPTDVIQWLGVQEGIANVLPHAQRMVQATNEYPGQLESFQTEFGP